MSSIKKAVIYARYSSHGQTEQSIEGQLHDAYDFAKREGFTIVAEYIDRAQTGRNDDRESFQQMITDANRHTFEYVIVWKLDRFARNRYDSAINKAKLKRNNVRVVSVMENITDSPEGIILEGMLESMAEYYSANLSVNIKRGQRETLSKGKFVGGSVPYGYRNVDGKLVIDEKKAPFVRQIFDMYISGVSKSDILDYLNKSGETSRSGKQLSHNFLWYMLSNPVYAGHYTRNGIVYEQCAEAIITDEVFMAARRRAALLKQAPSIAQANDQYLLSEKCRCGHCGAKMIGSSGRSKTGEKHYYYVCSNRKRSHSCDKASERKVETENYIIRETVAFVCKPSNAEYIADKLVEQYEKSFPKTRIQELKTAIARTEHEIQELIDRLIDAPKSIHKRLYERIDSLEASRSEYERQLAEETTANDMRINRDDVIKWLLSFRDGDIEDESFRRRIIDTFVNTVTISDNAYLITYNIHPLQPTDDPNDPNNKPSKSSPPTQHAPPIRVVDEPELIFFLNGFGCLLPNR